AEAVRPGSRGRHQPDAPDHPPAPVRAGGPAAHPAQVSAFSQKKLPFIRWLLYSAHHFQRAGSNSRGVAQPGSALAWGARGRVFESLRPDQIILKKSSHLAVTGFFYARSKICGSQFGGFW